MKKYLFLVAILLLTISMTVSAQNYNNRRGANNRRFGMDNRRSEQLMKFTPQERVDMMTKELDLTPEQATQVLELCKKHEAIRTAQVTEHRIQRGTGAVDRVARRDEFRAMRDEQMKKQQEELAQIIGKEKADKWNELRQDVRDYNRSGRTDGRGGRGYSSQR